MEHYSEVAATMTGDIIAATFLVALIFVLVRPQSKAAEAVKVITDALASIVTTATREPGE